MLARRIARFLEHTGLQQEVTSPDGFKVTLQEVDTQIPVTIDAREGTSLTIQSEVPQSTLGTAKSITVTFSISGKGVLEEIEALGVDQASSNSKNADQLSYYLARNVFELVTQAPDKSIEVESSSSLNPKTEETPASDENIEAEEPIAFVPSEGIEESDQQSDLQKTVEAQGAVSESVTSHAPDITPVEKGERSDQTPEEQDPPLAAVEEVEPVAEANREELSPSENSESQQAEPVVLEITSLFSGKKTEITLPPDPDLKSAGHTSPTTATSKETEASETIYESAAISVIENKERGGIEVRFAEKPSKDWTAKLKTQSFRFSNKDSDPRWWRKASKVSVPAIKKFAEDYDSAVREKEETSQDAADTSPIEESSNARESNQQRADGQYTACSSYLPRDES